jgi:hypothetical protein
MEEINEAIQEVNENSCIPPLPDQDVRGLARSVVRSEPHVEEWPEPGELPEPQQLRVPALPEGLLPKSLALWLQDCAERLCLPLEMLAVPALVSLGALVGRSVGICPKEQDDWLVVPNLWGAVIARPGWMKSPAISEAMRPFQQLATRAHEEAQLRLVETGAREDCLQAQIDGIKQRMRSAAAKGNQELSSLEVELAQLKNALREAKVEERRYVTQDPTVEKLGELLKQNPRGLLLLRDELAGWLRNLDKSGREGEREFYLEAWNGTQDFTFDRIGRGTVHIPSTTLSIFGGIQPGKLRAYVAGAMENGRGADGLIQRFQVLVWPDSIPRWKNIDRAPNATALDTAFEIFQFLDQLVPANWGEDIREVRGIPALRFDSEAQEFFNFWRDLLEKRLRSDEMAGRDAFESHLAKYRSLMPSLALLHHLVEVVAGTSFNPTKVGHVHAEMAAGWCEFLEGHAEKIYAAEGPENAALALGRRILEGKVQNGTTCREIYRHGWANLENRERVMMAIEVLEDAHWVKIEEVSPGAEGGRPLLRVLINPKLKVTRG